MKKVDKWQEKGLKVTRASAACDPSLLESLKGCKYKLGELSGVHSNEYSGNTQILSLAVFCSPEVITSSWWQKALTSKLKSLVSLIAVDEAHCVEEWGREFKPAYKELRHLRTIFPSVPFMAISATLPPSIEFLTSKAIGPTQPSLFPLIDLISSMLSVRSKLWQLISVP